MAYVERHEVDVTTATDGSFTGYTPPVTGLVSAIRYAKNNFASTADFAVTVEGTGEGLWTEANVNASKVVYPRVGVHDAVGVAATLDGTRAMRAPVAVCKDRIKIVIAQGGNTKSGTFFVTVI